MSQTPQQKLVAAQTAITQRKNMADKKTQLGRLKAQLDSAMVAGVIVANPTPTTEAPTIVLAADQETQILCIAAISHWNSLRDAAPDSATRAAVDAEIQNVPDITGALHSMTVAQFRELALSYSTQIKGATDAYIAGVAAIMAS